MNLFHLAIKQLIREGKKPTFDLMLDRAIIIRKWLDMQARNKKVANNRYKRFVVV